MVARGGGAWLLGGLCMVDLGGGMHGCSGCVWLLRGGHVWLIREGCVCG